MESKLDNIKANNITESWVCTIFIVKMTLMQMLFKQHMQTLVCHNIHLSYRFKWYLFVWTEISLYDSSQWYHYKEFCWNITFFTNFETNVQTDTGNKETHIRYDTSSTPRDQRHADGQTIGHCFILMSIPSPRWCLLIGLEKKVKPLIIHTLVSNSSTCLPKQPFSFSRVRIFLSCSFSTSWKLNSLDLSSSFSSITACLSSTVSCKLVN